MLIRTIALWSAVALSACSASSAQCSADCQGCCVEGVCYGGREDATCGLSGNECSVCAVNARCVQGLCVLSATQGGNTGGGQGSGPRDAGTQTQAGLNTVAACNRLVTGAQCGADTFSLDCAQYRSSACDLSAYFDCASRHYVCRGGTYDTDLLNSFSEDCPRYATCP